MYRLSVDTSTGQHYQATTDTGDETLEILRDHLTRHLLAGPVNWSVTSPWGAQHLGRINLNGNTHDVDNYLADALYGQDSIQDGLAREFYHQHQPSETSDSMPTSTTSEHQRGNEP
jgi:hypothetical protein